MIISASNIELTDDVLKKCQKWYHNGANLKKASSQKKYPVLYWGDISLEKFKKELPNLNKSLVCDYLYSDTVSNKDILLLMFKHIELKNEEYLWSSLVDSRIISDDLYQSNTYEENFEIWYKTNKNDFLNINKPTKVYTFDDLDTPEKQASRREEANRLEREKVYEFLRKINTEYIESVQDNGEGVAIFLFKKGLTIPYLGVNNSDLHTLSEEEKKPFYQQLENCSAISVRVGRNGNGEKGLSKQYHNNLSISQELERLLKAEKIQNTDRVSSHIKRWIKEETKLLSK